jgi:hypothetical protein
MMDPKCLSEELPRLEFFSVEEEFLAPDPWATNFGNSRDLLSVEEEK